MAARRLAIVGPIALATMVLLSSCALLSEQLPPSPSLAPSAAAPSVDPSPAPSQTAQAVVTVAGIDVDGMNVSASGYVSGIVEDGGTCVFTFTGLSGEVEVTSTGVADVVTTSCGFVQAPSESFARGSWTATLSYTSETSKAVSEAVPLEIP